MRETTIGQLLLENALPPETYQPGTELNKKGVKKLFQHLATHHPDKYRQLSQKLNEVGSTVSYREGTSFNIDDFKTPGVVLEARHRIHKKLARVLSNPNFTPQQRNEKIIEVVGEENDRLLKDIVEATRKNPLTEQMLSGARGNPAALKRLIGGDLLYLNHRDEPIPILVESSYSEGLKPHEYWAATYGARKGLAEGKLGVGEGGYLAKLLNQITHRLMVTAIDSPEDLPEGAVRGLPVDIDDPDNVGALLAENIGGHKRNTLITPGVLKDIKKTGRDEILVRSPIVGGPPDGGLYARDVGHREYGRLPDLGSLPGLTASQSLGERLAQVALSSKHAGGVTGAKTIGGFPAIEQMINVPKHYTDGATHAQVDGKIRSIEENPLGGWHINVGTETHFVSPGLNPNVKLGDFVEAGDILSEGLPNPAELVRHKGIGEGARTFVKHFLDVFHDAGMPANRRNVELLARGFINHVEFNEDYENWLPGDIAPYTDIEQNWQMRDGTRLTKPTDDVINKYLEQPVLHYTVGTRITPSVLNNLKKYNIIQLQVHDEPPPFNPVAIRGAASVSTDPNWLSRLLGSQQQKVLLGAARRGDEASLLDLSYVPAKAQGEMFGKEWPNRLLEDFK